MKKVSLVIMDLDNTIYDWYSSFIPAFYAMIDKASELTLADREELINQIREVHILKNDVEHPFSLVETPLIKEYIERVGPAVATEQLDIAFHAFNRIRKSNLRLFDGVERTINILKKQCVEIVAFTESRYFAAVGRVDRLEIGDCFSRVYCRESNKSSRPSVYPTRELKFPLSKVVVLPSSGTKPNPLILKRIISDFNVDTRETAYIGDSISKDIMMAQEVGCFSVWAKYGANVDPDLYEKLVKISHWSKEDIERARFYSRLSESIVPDFICHESMVEILSEIRGPCS